MSLILSGTDGLSDVDGSAATPAIRGTDANTGIFFPAADTIAFAEGGVEAMRIADSGYVGIGTTTPNAKLEVAGAISTGTTNNFVRVNQAYLSSGGDYVMLANNAWFNGSAWTTPANGGLYQITGQSHVWYTQTSGAFTSVASITPAGLFQFNSGYGSVATAYGCRAWVNFNGTGTVAIRGSGNVSSITDNGTGDYTINLTTAMPDVNYSVSGSSANTNYTATNSGYAGGFGLKSAAFTTSAFTIGTSDVTRTSTALNIVAASDASHICITVFR